VIFSPLRRGFHDRVAGTFVMPGSLVAAVSTEHVAVYERAEARAAPRWTPQGAAASFRQRRRARAWRLDDAPLLVVAVIPLAASLEVADSLLVVALVSLAWLAIFVVDETRRISRHGTTPGHRRAGLAVVDRRTGLPPTRGRALARAVVLAPLLYVPPLQVVLLVWVSASSQRRGPHDLAGGTVVIDTAAPAPTPPVRWTAPPTPHWPAYPPPYPAPQWQRG
jgi:uncharacterized RDD family membrane protein YckC